MKLRTALPLIVTGLALTLVTACSGCGGKKKKSRDDSPLPAVGEATPEATAVPEATTIVDESVGEEVPPITNDGVATIDTDAAAAIKHLIFETSATLESGRYLSEYLMVIRANEASCVRLKIRPTAGVNQQVDDEAIKDGTQGGDACSGQTAETKEATPEPSESPSAGLNLTPRGMNLARGSHTQVAAPDGPNPDDLQWATPENKRARGFQLAPQSAAICTPRLFRMEQGGANAIEPVTSKIGLLRAVGTKVRIWLDEEYLASCTSASAGQVIGSTIPYGPLIQEGTVPQTWKDALFQDHLINLAAELDKIVTKIQATYGPISDIDESGFIEVFLSPDVNRNEFNNHVTTVLDHFDARLLYKPQDLAFYDSKTNPTSNEGEVIYLWAPDPAGIYTMGQTPTENSLTSNYAKGYAASQAMTLIFANSRLLLQKQKVIPDPWLVQSFALLASGYYAGDDYSWRALANYLSARHQTLSLLDGPDPGLVSAAYMPLAQYEAVGMRGMFGWFLHSRLCGGTTVAPCAALKSFVDSSKTGIAAVEEITGLVFKDLMANFALSVGVSLLDEPTKALSFFSVDPLPAGTPSKPTLLPDLTEIFPTDPPVTVEATNSGSALVSLAPEDRTLAGPFPSKDILVFQPLAADNDMEFKLASNSVAYVLVTGLIDPKTDMTAYFGKGLNVVFIPIGERNGSLRRLHVEKLSETAHGDQRPENLTQTVNADSTYSSAKSYPGVEYSVTPTREVWSLGSIDNYLMNIEGSASSVGDTDAYELDIQPCSGLTGASLVTCNAKLHKVLVQVYIRDFDKELKPMLLVTDTSRKIFRGHSIYGRLKDWDKTLEDIDDVMLCQSAQMWPSLTLVLTNGSSTISVAGGGNHGLSTGDDVQFMADDGVYTNGALFNYPYKVNKLSNTTFQLLDPNLVAVTFTGPFPSTYRLGTGASNACASGGVLNKPVFDHDVTTAFPTGFAHRYDNFLSMGAVGFPFTTRRTLSWGNQLACPGTFCYYAEEASRQNLVFDLKLTTEINDYSFYAVSRGTTPGAAAISSDDLGVYVAIKNRMDTALADPDPDNSALDAAFVTECATVASLSVDDCAKIFSEQVRVEDLIINYLVVNDLYVVCRSSTNCPQELKLFRAGVKTQAWLATDRYFWYRATSATLSTYYRSIHPLTRDDYCGGDPTGLSTQFTPCSIEGTVGAAGDIREQLNVSTSKLALGNCSWQTLGTGFDACIDFMSVYDMNAPDEYVYWWETFSNPTDRDVVLAASTYSDANPVSTLPRRAVAIAARSGEIIAKPERFQAVEFLVPGTGKIANVIVGGREQSQGKYLLRARIFNH